MPEAVDHVKVVVDPREDRTWLQSQPQVPTDGVHSFDAIGPAETSAENWSEAVKRLKPRLLQRLIDAFKRAPCEVHLGWQHACSCSIRQPAPWLRAAPDRPDLSRGGRLV